MDAIKSMQILVHTLLINVPIPASASIVFSSLMNLITLQLFDMNPFFAVLFKTDNVNPISD